jgi:threonine dehydratase
MPTLDRFVAARARIRDLVVETPLFLLTKRATDAPACAKLGGVTPVPTTDARLPPALLLKAECLQVTGSFKARGALSRVLATPPDALARGVVTASGGNHGAAVAYAAQAAGASATVFLPSSTPDAKAERIARWGARVERAGSVWDEAHEAAVAFAAREGASYVHPFADEEVLAGQGTVGLELLAQAEDVDLVVIAIGGGGLAAGVAEAVRLVKPGTRIVGVEPEGAPTLAASLARGELVTLERVTTRAGTLAPRRSDPLVFELIQRHVERVVLVSDEEMHEAARFLLAHVGLGVELSGAAALAAVLSGKVDLGTTRAPCVLVCGAGDDAARPLAPLAPPA